MSAAVIVEGARAGYGSGFSLQIDSLRLEQGERLLIRGGNGSGKTTLLDLLAGLMPGRGSLTVAGVDLTRGDEGSRRQLRRELVARIDQDCVCVPHLDLQANITLPQRLRGATVDRPRLAALAERFGIADLLARRADRCSGGERQRAVIVRSLLAAPRLLLADEPTAHVDADSVPAVIDHLLAAAGDAAVVVVSHDPVVQQRFERQLQMRAGRLHLGDP